MLDSFIIEEIRRRERQRRKETDHPPAVELPVPVPDKQPRRRSEEADKEERSDRGVVVIDL
jgi:hypothetical protein